MIALRVALTRPVGRASPLQRALEAGGAIVSSFPAIAIAPPADWTALDEALDRVAEYEWIIFTSANAVASIADRWALRIGALPLPSPPQLACIGPASAAALLGRIRTADFVARQHTAEAFASTLPVTTGARVLFPAADIARGAIATVLEQRNVLVDRVAAYRTGPGAGVASLVEALRESQIDVILFASPSAVEHVADALLDQHVQMPAIVCIGLTTAASVAARGFAVSEVAAELDEAGLLAAVARAGSKLKG